jgi:hypothetical protein
MPSLDFNSALYDADFTTSISPESGVYITPYPTLQVNKTANTITQSTNNNGTWIEGEGVVFRPSSGFDQNNIPEGKCLNYSWDMSLSNVAVDFNGLFKVSNPVSFANIKIGVRSISHGGVNIYKSDGVTSGVGYIYTGNSVVPTNYNFTNYSLKVSTNKTSTTTSPPFDIPPNVSFAIKVINKTGVLLGQFGTEVEGYISTGEDVSTADHVYKIDLTHDSIVAGQWTVISASHPAVLNWPTHSQLIDSGLSFVQVNSCNLYFGFAPSQQNMEVHIDRLTLSKSVIGAQHFEITDITNDFPILLPENLDMSGTTLSNAEYFKIPVSGITANNHFVYLEGSFAYCAARTSYVNPRIFAMRSSLLQTGGQTQQQVESFACHLGGNTQINGGYDATKTVPMGKFGNSFTFTDDSNVPNYKLNIPPTTFWTPFKIIIKRATTGWRFYFNGVDISQWIGYSFNDNNVSVDPLTTCPSFVTPSNIDMIGIGCGRTEGFHFLNEDFFIMKRLAWFNSLSYSDAELQSFTSLSDTENNFLNKNMINSLLQGLCSGMIK